jgi:hypothetical protein
MQRLRYGRERGGVAVTVALLTVPLLVILAFVVDAGLLHWEKVQLQNGADAAALAVAEKCAKEGPSCTSGATALAAGISGRNANDAQAAAFLPPAEFVVNTSSGKVEVISSTLNSEGTEVRHPFASLVDPGGSTIEAMAAAQWGTPIRGSVLPLAIAECELETIETDPVVAKQIFLRSDNEAQDCPGAYPGGFGWLDDGDRDCWVEIGVDGYVEGTTGNNPGKTGCTAADFKGLLGTTVLVPIYSDFDETTGGKREAGGAQGKYYIEKFAAFTVTGYKTSGSDDTYYGSSSPSFKGPGADDCDKSGKCRGLRGYFVRYVELGEDFELGEGGPDGGLTIVKLTQ